MAPSTPSLSKARCLDAIHCVSARALCTLSVGQPRPSQFWWKPLNKSLRHKSGGRLPASEAASLHAHVPFTTVNVSWFDSGGPPAATAPVAGSSLGVSRTAKLEVPVHLF